MPVISTTHKTINRLLSLLNQTKMNIIFQDRFPVRTIVLIGVAFLITTQIYAQNADARLSLTLRNATLKEFVKRIENSTGYSFIYSEEITIKHKINLQVKDKPLREILDLAFKNEQISYQFTGRHILLQKKKESKTVSRKFTISGYVTDGTSSETLIGTNIIESSKSRNNHQSLRFLQHHPARRRNRTAFLLSGLCHRSASFYALTRYIAEYPYAGKHAVAGGSDRFR